MKHIFLSICLLVLVGLVGFSVYKYQTRPKPLPGETVQQAVAAESAVKQTLKEHDTVAQAAINNANSVITTLNAQKVTLCTEIKTNRLSQNLCP